ncbi:hypothetical protein MLT40_23305 [Escherichia coli]|nr:hypothetical protein [Escherichia coli]
MEKVSDAAEPC